MQGARGGFFWTIYDPDNPSPAAWCTACNDRVHATGGEWIGEALEHCQPQVLCGDCYDLAKHFHMGGDPWAWTGGHLSAMARRIAIKGYKLDKAGKLVPCYKHLPINIQLQKRASQRVRADKAAKSAISQP